MEMHSVPERKSLSAALFFFKVYLLEVFGKSQGLVLLPCSFRIVLRIFVQFSYLFIFFISFKLNSNFLNFVF